MVALLTVTATLGKSKCNKCGHTAAVGRTMQFVLNNFMDTRSMTVKYRVSSAITLYMQSPE